MVVVLFWDGLRPDFIRPDITPNLCRFANNGIRFTNHHAVFPTETRVNASSVATGCYPGTHGVVGNRIYVPEAEIERPLNTGDHEDLQALERIQPILSVPTLSKVLKDHGKKYGIFSSGSPGSSWVQCSPNDGHMTNVRGVVHPKELERDIKKTYGTFPPESVPATARNDLTVQLMIDAVKTGSYDVIFGWFCDPDLTQHKVGLGAPLALQAIRENDKRLGALLELTSGDDVLVCSDHGFSSLTEPFNSKQAFEAAGFDFEQMVWVGNGVVLKQEYQKKREDVVAFLAEQSWVGPIFTKGDQGNYEGQISGTFSFDMLNLDHARTPDVVFSGRWTDQVNSFGVPGLVFGSGGIASHGSCSPYDLHNVLIANGPHFKQGEESQIPSGIIDIAPTIQYLVLGKIQSKMDGRVLFEGLINQAGQQKIENKTFETKRGSRRQFIKISRVDNTAYIDKGWV